MDPFLTFVRKRAADERRERRTRKKLRDAIASPSATATRTPHNHDPGAVDALLQLNVPCVDECFRHQRRMQSIVAALIGAHTKSTLSSKMQSISTANP